MANDYLSRITPHEGIGSLQLGPQAYIDPRDQRYVHDAYQYFLNQQGGGTGGGQDAATMPPIDKGTSSPAITSADYPEHHTGPMLSSGITSASIVQPTSDPFLASGAAGGARLPPMDQAGAVAAMTQPEAYNIPGTMPQTPVSGAWGPQQQFQDQGPRVTLPSGDVFAADDPMLPEKMDYTPTTESQSAWEKVQSGLSNIKDFASKYGQQAVSFFMGMANPMLGMAAKLMPQDTPIDKFNREYAIGGDLYQNVVSQVDDPNFAKRLEGYSQSLGAGNIQNQDPFGKNTVSLMGDYPAMATNIYNELTEKAKTRELSQFDKDRLEYYGHVSGLTGKTNIPETPLMTDTSPLKTFPGGDDIDFPPLKKPEVIGPHKWDTFPPDYIDPDVTDAELYGDTSTLPQGPPGILNPYEPQTLATDKWNTGAFTDLDVSDAELFGEPTTEYFTTRPAGIDAVAPSDFGEDVDFEQGFLDTEPAVTTPIYTPPRGGGADVMDVPTPKKTPTYTAPKGPRGDEQSGPSGPKAPSGSTASGGPTYGPHGGASYGPHQGGGGGGGGGGGCFLKGTLVTMADGSTKAVEQVDLGDNVAKGGKVFATGKFLVDNLHDYKGIKVSGSHMVNEDGNWTRVEDSKHGKPLGDDEHTVYVFGAENRRILINNILFTDYFEVKEQEKLSEGDKFFDNWKLHAKVDSDNNVNVLNAS